MDWQRLRTLVAKLHVAAYQEGLNEGRREVSKDIAQHVQAELEEFIYESKKAETPPSPAPAAAGTPGATGTAGVPGPLTPKPVWCSECKHGEISPIEGTATCKKSGVVFEDYSKCVPCKEFEPNELPEWEPIVKDGILQVCNNCKYLRPIGVVNEGRCLHGGTHETNTDKHFCNLFEPSLEALAAASNKQLLAEQMENAVPAEADADEKEDEGDERCWDCVYFDRRKNWCKGHRMPTIPDGNACHDFRARSSVKCGDCAKYSPLVGCSSGMETADLGLSSACGEFKPKERS